METSPAIPTTLLQRGRILMNEPAPGVRAQLEEMLLSIPPSKLENGPAELPRLAFLLSWLAATVGERSSRFAPVGFARAYSFDDSDFASALDTLIAWVNSVSKGKTNIDPAQLPWPAIRSTCASYAFGGRIDVEMDQQVLDSFVTRLFSPRAYDVGFELVKGLVAPDGRTIASYLEWARTTLPETGEHPALLNLPALSAAFVAASRGEILLSSLRKMRNIDDDDERVVSAAMTPSKTSARPAWIVALQQSATGFLGLLPTSLATQPVLRNAKPLERFFAREMQLGSSLLITVRKDLQSIIEACKGAKQTNRVRELMADVSKGLIPQRWQRYTVKQNMGLGAWIADLAARLKHLEEGSASGFANVWLGGLFAPTSYITATRQEQAHLSHISLERLKLILRLDDSSITSGGFNLTGLSLQCASFEDGALQLNNGETVTLTRARLEWVDATLDTSSSTTTAFGCPAYLNADRRDLLFAVDLAVKRGTDVTDYVQRGVCLLAHN